MPGATTPSEAEPWPSVASNEVMTATPVHCLSEWAGGCDERRHRSARGAVPLQEPKGNEHGLHLPCEVGPPKPAFEAAYPALPRWGELRRTLAQRSRKPQPKARSKTL